MKKLIIAIDGPAGSGKSTTAKLVASRLGYLYIDTGAMYRAVTLLAIRKNILNDIEAIISELNKTTITLVPSDGTTKILLNEEDISIDIRSPEINEQVSFISSIAEVRRALVNHQRKLGEGNSVVMEGRDIGTIVFPGAELKIFLVASLDVRAERRLLEYRTLGREVTFEEVRANLEKRDYLDSHRDCDPLAKALDAIELDTTNLTIEQQVGMIIDMAQKLRA
jgi:cytidylate kinase